jgi:hypothetical protein
VRLEHSGYHLSVLLTALAKASCSLHGAGCRTYPGVDIGEQRLCTSTTEYAHTT